MPTVNIEEEMINAAGSRLAAEIDFGVMCGFLEEIGWTKVILKPMTKNIAMPLTIGLVS